MKIEATREANNDSDVVMVLVTSSVSRGEAMVMVVRMKETKKKKSRLPRDDIRARAYST